MKRTMMWGVTVDAEITYSGQNPTKGRTLSVESLTTSRPEAAAWTSPAGVPSAQLVRVLVVR